MATKAYILIETAVGKTKDVTSALNSLDDIVNVDAVTGPYDIIAIVNSTDLTKYLNPCNIAYINLTHH